MVLGNRAAEFNLPPSPAVNQIRAIRRFSDDAARSRNEGQCEEQDSNLHSFRNEILSSTRK
jgi:hypothetical protein